MVSKYLFLICPDSDTLSCGTHEQCRFKSSFLISFPHPLSIISYPLHTTAMNKSGKKSSNKNDIGASLEQINQIPSHSIPVWNCLNFPTSRLCPWRKNENHRSISNYPTQTHATHTQIIHTFLIWCFLPLLCSKRLSHRQQFHIKHTHTQRAEQRQTSKNHQQSWSDPFILSWV